MATPCPEESTDARQTRLPLQTGLVRFTPALPSSAPRIVQPRLEAQPRGARTWRHAARASTDACRPSLSLQTGWVRFTPALPSEASDRLTATRGAAERSADVATRRPGKH